MEARVAVLEEIAKSTRSTLERIEGRLDGLTAEMREMRRELSGEQRADFRWLFGLMLGGFAGIMGVMAHGFYWV